jgi:hypothetical protein
MGYSNADLEYKWTGLRDNQGSMATKNGSVGWSSHYIRSRPVRKAVALSAIPASSLASLIRILNALVR